MRPILASKKVVFYLLSVVVLTIFTFTLSNIQTQKPQNSSASSSIQYVPTKLYKSYIANEGEENVTISGEIYIPGGSIPTGSLVVVGVSAIASGAMTVTDSQGNHYNQIVSNEISGTARVYLYNSIITQPLQSGDKIIVGNTKLSALAFSVMPFTGVSQLVQSDVLSGNSINTKTASIKNEKDQIVVTALGVNAKSSSVGFAQIATNVQNCAPVATDKGNDESNIYLYLCSYITFNSGTQSIEHSLLRAFPWATVTATFK